MAAVLLAAGASARMGSPKALLPDHRGHPFVVRLVRTFHAAGVDRLVVVTGAHHEAIADAVSGDGTDGVQLVRNPDPSRGQLSSLWVGLDAVEPLDPEAVLVTLVDVPFVRASTVRAVVDAWRRTRAPIVRPAIGDRHGHPVLFGRALFGELRQAPLDQGAKPVVHAHLDALVNVSVDDEGAVTDVDTPEEYARILAEFK